MESSTNTSRTRSKNKDQHPGAVEVATKRKRRTKAQKAIDDAIEIEKRKEIQRKEDEQITSIAKFEGKMAQKDIDADRAHPRSQNGDILVTFLYFYFSDAYDLL